MLERKRKNSSLNAGETVLVKKCPMEHLYSLPKRQCFPTTQNLVENGNFQSNQMIGRVNVSLSNQNQGHKVMETNTTGYFPYQDVNYKPRICLMCVAGDSTLLTTHPNWELQNLEKKGHINHILS